MRTPAACTALNSLLKTWMAMKFSLFYSSKRQLQYTETTFSRLHLHGTHYHVVLITLQLSVLLQLLVYNRSFCSPVRSGKHQAYAAVTQLIPAQLPF